MAYSEEELLGLNDERRELLAELTAFALAVSRDETDALARPLLERRRRELLARLVDAEHELDSMGMSDAMLRSRYRNDPEWELTVRHLIALSDRHEGREQRAVAREKAARALARIRAGEPFPDVAAEVSEEPGAEARQGLLQPGRRGAWVPEFWDAANALRVGEVSPVVETQYGFHVIRLEGRDTVPYAEARPRVLLETAGLMGVSPDAATASAPPDLAVARDVVDRVDDPLAPDSLTAASWSGGRLTLGALRDHMAALPLREWRVAMDGATERRVAAAERAVALRVTADSARTHGLEVPEAAAAELARDWEATVERWTADLGFVQGGTPEDVKAAAMEALGASNQNATLARQQIHMQAPLVRRAYPVRVRRPEAEGGGTGA